MEIKLSDGTTYEIEEIGNGISVEKKVGVNIEISAPNRCKVTIEDTLVFIR